MLFIAKLNFDQLFSAAPSNNDTGQPYKDWVFINYTFKRFEGLTQRGPILPKHYQWKVILLNFRNLVRNYVFKHIACYFKLYRAVEDSCNAFSLWLNAFQGQCIGIILERSVFSLWYFTHLINNILVVSESYRNCSFWNTLYISIQGAQNYC